MRRRVEHTTPADSGLTFVAEESVLEGDRRRTIWICKCICGKETRVRASQAHRGEVRSCGCQGAIKATHGHTRGRRPSKAYKTWTRIKARCEDVNSPHYAKYGARGIYVCERWQRFENFIEDMGEVPAGLSIDRIDNNGPYAPNNCRWATTVQQNRNRRFCKLTEESAAQIRARRGENTKALAEEFGVDRRTINRVLSGELWK